MCGIYGMAKKPNHQSKRQLKRIATVLRELAVLSEERGEHSSGLAVIGDAECQIYKSLLKSSKFVTSREWATSMRNMPERHIYLGHTRFATSGSISIDNAHPFKVGRTIGAHNGCLSNMNTLQDKLEKYCEVDSQLIFKAIDSSDTIQDAVDYLRGDFALSFVKDTYNVLHLCREQNRPLSVAYWKEGRVLFYASCEEYVEKALLKANIFDTDVIKLEKNNLYSFDILEFSNEKTGVEKVGFNFESKSYYGFFGSSYSSHLGTFSDTSNSVVFRDSDILYQTDTILDDEYGPRNIIDSELLDGRFLQDKDDRDWFYDTHKNEWFCLDLRTDKMLSQDEWKELRVELSYQNECEYCGIDKDIFVCSCDNYTSKMLQKHSRGGK